MTTEEREMVANIIETNTLLIDLLLKVMPQTENYVVDSMIWKVRCANNKAKTMLETIDE